MIGRKLMVAGAITVVLVAACSGGGSTTAPSGTAGATAGSSVAPEPSAGAAYKIAMVGENTQDAFWGTFVCGGQDRAEKLGVDLQVSVIPNTDTQTLSTTLDTALLDEPDGVVFNPVQDAASFDPKIKQIMDSGVPVVTSTDDTQNPSHLLYVNSQPSPSSDAVEAAGDLAATLGAGKAVNLIGLPFEGQLWEQQRLYPLSDAVKAANPDLEWLPDQVDDFDVNKGTQMISSLIIANPDLKLILAVAGPEGQAAAAAVEQNGMSGQVHIISIDAVPAQVEALRNGTIDFLVAQQAYNLGAEEVQALVDWLNSNPDHTGPVAPTGTARIFPTALLTKDNLDTPEGQSYMYNPNCS